MADKRASEAPEHCVSGHLPTESEINSWPEFTRQRPMRILVSACLVGTKCGVDGSSYGEYPEIVKLLSLPNVKTVQFCPEDFSFGTPRNMPDIHGGDGFDVLDGKARVLTDKGEDWTEGMITAAQRMLAIAQAECIDLAILQDMSAACGTQVISEGCRLVEVRRFQNSVGVCAALLLRNGFKAMSERDFKTLERLRKKLDPTHKIDDSAIDYHESQWYMEHFDREPPDPRTA